jgi:quercetin dioxygenase-like cupin family protein
VVTKPVIRGKEYISCEGENLLNVPDRIAVQNAVMRKGSVLEDHCHTDVKEILIVYGGKLEIVGELSKMVFLGGIGNCLTEGDVLLIPPGVMHGLIACENTYLIGITIPPDEGYPGNKSWQMKVGSDIQNMS